jgi:hypothetical protein
MTVVLHKSAGRRRGGSGFLTQFPVVTSVQLAYSHRVASLKFQLQHAHIQHQLRNQTLVLAPSKQFMLYVVFR